MCLCRWIVFSRQKSAYEMLISDWSSDVCSSDLLSTPVYDSSNVATRNEIWGAKVPAYTVVNLDARLDLGFTGMGDKTYLQLNVGSEEHTSELQSLMRISYAVFCLTKKKT